MSGRTALTNFATVSMRSRTELMFQVVTVSRIRTGNQSSVIGRQSADRSPTPSAPAPVIGDACAQVKRLVADDW